MIIHFQRKRSSVNWAINTLGTAWQGEGSWDTWHCCGIGISYFSLASIHYGIFLNIAKLWTVNTSVFFRDCPPGDGPPLSCCPFPITSLRPFMAKPVKYTSPSTLKKIRKYSWRNYLLTRDSEIPVHFPNSTCQLVSAAKCLGVPLLRGEEKISFSVCSSACEVSSTHFIEHKGVVFSRFELSHNHRYCIFKKSKHRQKLLALTCLCLKNL